MGSWKVGRAFGIDIFIHWTFFLLLGFVALQNRGEELGFGPLHATLLLTLIFACVVLHELGHALMARRVGVATLDITLYPIGGVARLERMPEKPFEEVCVALAGPAVNVAIAGILLVPFLIISALNQDSIGMALEPGRASLLTELIIGNLILVAFNMLPAFPTDGGRVLRALMAGPFGRLSATRIAATIGAVFAFLFALAALATGHLLWIALAFFLFLAGQQELAHIHRECSRRRRISVSAAPFAPDILDVVPVPVEHAVWDPNRRVWVLWQDGSPVRTFGMPGSQG